MTLPLCRLGFKVIYFTSYSIGQRRAGSGTHLSPPRAQRSEIYSRVCSNPPPPHKARATMSCRAPVVCLVTVPDLSRAWAQQPCRGGETPSRSPLEHRLFTVPVSCLNTAAGLVLRHSSRPAPPPRAPVVCLATVPVSCLDTQQPVSCSDKAAVPGGNPPPGPPSSTPLGAGSQILSRAWTQQTTCRGGTLPRTPSLEHAPWCWVTDFVSCLDIADLPGGSTPPGLPPLEHVPSCWDT